MAHLVYRPDPRLIFTAALKANACGIILAHNHTSGNLQPSQAGLAITARLRQAGAVLENNVLDHLIVTSENYLPLADKGLFLSPFFSHFSAVARAFASG